MWFSTALFGSYCYCLIASPVVTCELPVLDADRLLMVPVVPMSPTPSDSTVLATTSESAVVEAVSAGRRSCGVTADLGRANTMSVSVGESILSLLLQLHTRFSSTKSRPSYRFTQSTARVGVASRVGDGEFFIRKVLDKICLESGNCLETVNSLCQQQASAGSDSSTGQAAHKDDVDER